MIKSSYDPYHFHSVLCHYDHCRSERSISSHIPEFDSSNEDKYTIYQLDEIVADFCENLAGCLRLAVIALVLCTSILSVLIIRALPAGRNENLIFFIGPLDFLHWTLDLGNPLPPSHLHLQYRFSYRTFSTAASDRRKSLICSISACSRCLLFSRKDLIMNYYHWHKLEFIWFLKLIKSYPGFQFKLLNYHL